MDKSEKACMSYLKNQLDPQEKTKFSEQLLSDPDIMSHMIQFIQEQSLGVQKASLDFEFDETKKEYKAQCHGQIEKISYKKIPLRASHHLESLEFQFYHLKLRFIYAQEQWLLVLSADTYPVECTFVEDHQKILLDELDQQAEIFLKKHIEYQIYLYNIDDQVQSLTFKSP